MVLRRSLEIFGLSSFTFIGEQGDINAMRGQAQWKDLMLPTAVVAVVGMMIFPLPGAVLDVLLMCNISFALALLISAVYLAEPERFTSLPTILLLTTLFRLGLNIATTRQILGTGEAPDVIVTFGNFVVRGNLVVGAVVFVIITLVQFLVIAKGAERVAEVAARFTLDAMPGKQMSIDADIRSGLLSLLDAREKRRELQRESKLFGALDGAMKFVKGDAIAGILITIVNITAGFIIGVSQEGLGLAESMSKYTLFTIGDGLVSQIPALLVSVAAGIAVTRVSDKDGEFVGRDMLVQLGREPQALATTGVVLCALALVPGLPFLPFFLMSGVFIAAAVKGQRKSRDAERRVREGDFRPKVFAGILLRISVGGTLKLQEEAVLPSSVQTFRNEIFEKHGVIVPEIHFDVDPKLVGLKAIVFFQGVKLEETGSTMAVPEDGKGVFTAHVVEMIRRFTEAHLVELIDDTHTRMLLEVHQAGCEDLIHSVVPELVSITELTTLLRQLVAERVSIRSLSTIFQAIAEYKHGIRSEPTAKSIGGQRGGSKHLVPSSNCDAPVSSDLLGLLAAARQAMSRNISAMVANDRWEIRAWVLEGEVDQLLSKTAIAGVPLNPRLVERIMESTHSAAQQNVSNGPLVLLASRYARALLYSVIRGELENVFVLAIDEICEEAKLFIEGEICAINGPEEESSQLEMKEAA